jgi:hypothetical protein
MKPGFHAKGEYMTASKRYTVVIALLLTAAVACQAQWVMVARKASGRIQQMRQQNEGGTGGYDVAVVVIEAKAEKVYEVALQRLQAHADQVKIVKQDAKKQTVSFTNGQITASLQAYALGDKLTQLVVASTLDHSETSATSLVVKSIQQVCTELKATCTVEDNK